MLPEWPAGTVAVLATAAGGRAHAIPVSTAIRASDTAVLLALGSRRQTLQQLKEEPRVALSLFAPGLACTVHGRASVGADPLEPTRVVAVRIVVEDVQDHTDPRTAIEAGVAWRWTTEDATKRDAEVLDALRRLASAG